jgi:hypothetical protein
MKQPDVFVCVDGKNEKGLKDALGATVTLGNYWDTVVETFGQRGGHVPRSS